MGGLVVMEGSNIYTTTWIISENLGLQHKSVLKLLEEHSNITELERFEIAEVKTKGRPIKIACLNELQAIILVSLMKNSKEVIDFKVKLAREFLKNRMLLQQIATQRQNLEYQVEREQGKIQRKKCTDIIKDFVDYAVRQGSSNASRYYSNISKMEINGLFLIEQKFKNMREVLNSDQLHILEMADRAVQNAIIEGMEINLPYKDIYKNAKAKIEAISKIFPPSPIGLLLAHDKS